MLTSEEILLLLKKLNERVVIAPSGDFPFTVVTDGFGYSNDKKTGALQAKLSIMLEVAGKAGR